MKTLKFRDHLVPLVLSGEKYTTWRFFDDKDIQIGDELELINSDTKRKFADAIATDVVEKSYKDVSEADRVGHETFESIEKEISEYKLYYGDKWTPEEKVKIIYFSLR